MITDDAIVAELGKRLSRWPSSVIGDIRVEGGVIDLQVTGEGGPPARIRVPLPSTGRSQGWLIDDLDNAELWVDQFLIWIDEEVATGGLSASRVRQILDGESYVLLEGYGWRLSDPVEHERLSRAVGPEGWFARKPEAPH